MRLKNYNEELVLDTVKIVLENRNDLRPNKSFLMDVAAYTLNRIPPKYIISERGFTHEIVVTQEDQENTEALVNIIELISLVNKGVEVVSSRRKSRVPIQELLDEGGEELSEEELHLTYFYNMPHLFGRLLDSEKRIPVSDALITLVINGEQAIQAEPGWLNPYRTSEQTKGYFSFWPKADIGNTPVKRFELKIAFEHRDYAPRTFRKRLRIEGEYFVHDYIRADKIMSLGDIYLDS